jgi:hypothetical protein
MSKLYENTLRAVAYNLLYHFKDNIFESFILYLGIFLAWFGWMMRNILNWG